MSVIEEDRTDWEGVHVRRKELASLKRLNSSMSYRVNTILVKIPKAFFTKNEKVKL